MARGDREAVSSMEGLSLEVHLIANMKIAYSLLNMEMLRMVALNLIADDYGTCEKVKESMLI